MVNYVTDAIRGVYDGFNSTVFAYGQTGSGKTFTMFGSSWEEKVILSKKNSKSARMKIMDSQGVIVEKRLEGIIPRAIREVFEIMRKEVLEGGRHYTIYCSFIQIYNEKIYDLLQDIETKKPLKIRED